MKKPRPILISICILWFLLTSPGLSAQLKFQPYKPMLWQAGDVLSDTIKALQLQKKTSVFDQQVCQMTEMEYLSLRKTDINALPDCMSELGNLQQLDLSKTNLVTFPKVLLGLTQLRELSLAHTGIAYLPEDVDELRNLEFLDLSGSQVNVLPESIANIPNLKRVDMQLIDLSRKEQTELQQTFPWIEFMFSSPCQCK